MIGKVGRNVSRVFHGDGNAVGGDDMGILMNFAYRTNRHEYLPAWRLWAPPALERTTMTRYHVMPRLCLCLGQQGQEWFCLNCVEALFHRSNNNVRQNDVIGYDPRFQALFSIANWILADERTCNDYQNDVAGQTGFAEGTSKYIVPWEWWPMDHSIETNRVDLWTVTSSRLPTFRGTLSREMHALVRTTVSERELDTDIHWSKILWSQDSPRAECS